MVVLGHNRTDCLENILENISSQAKYDNLSGMETVVVRDDIAFFRPLLSVTKDEVITYARRHNVPYLPNSTPAHFQRGKVRNELVPCLDGWNRSFVPGLFKLNEVLSDMHEIVGVVVDDFVGRFVELEASIGRCVDGYLGMGQYFWTLVLKKLFPGLVFRTRMMERF